MGLNQSKGNMYDFISHTWNTIKGECPHGCTYCYMHRWGKLNKARFDKKELKTDLGSGNFIFVGSSCDMFAKGIPREWVIETLDHCKKFPGNKYLFQTKNPSAINDNYLPANSVVCTTIETNRHYEDIMKDSPPPFIRGCGMLCIDVPKYVTIEPVMDFDFDLMLELIISTNAVQVNIGADSGGNNLPEPSKEKLLNFIMVLKEYTTVVEKKNLKRLLK